MKLLHHSYSTNRVRPSGVIMMWQFISMAVALATGSLVAACPSFDLQCLHAATNGMPAWVMREVAHDLKIFDLEHGLLLNEIARQMNAHEIDFLMEWKKGQHVFAFAVSSDKNVVIKRVNPVIKPNNWTGGMSSCTISSQVYDIAASCEKKLYDGFLSSIDRYRYFPSGARSAGSLSRAFLFKKRHGTLTLVACFDWPLYSVEEFDQFPRQGTADELADDDSRKAYKKFLAIIKHITFRFETLLLNH